MFHTNRFGHITMNFNIRDILALIIEICSTSITRNKLIVNINIIRSALY